ncbi:MAG TPA: transglycosylase SLT domain-containing protein, partial [Paraburkholderia sp.]|nr:transglycosylase SLT domain-containing protein [Paraburkholderia sp.]
MNAWLSWRPNERLAQVMRGALRQGTRVSHHLFSVVGGFAVLFALTLWLMPSWRLTLATRLMPFVSAAVQAGPARLLQGNPLPSFAPQQRGNAAPQDDTLSSSSNTGTGDTPNTAAAAADAGYNVASDNNSFTAPSGASVSTGLSSAALNGLDPRTLPSVSAIASMIPSQRVSPDARDDRVLVSTREQDLVATFIARRYRVAQEPVSELVKAAFDTGREVGLDPLLLLAVMAIESGFNPYAESGVGAKGLMQVMSTVHSDKFRYFGGQSAAL